MTAENKLISLLAKYKELGIEGLIDYKKFYLYSLITHSTAIEGSTVTEVENQLLFDEGISAKGRSISEQLMNLDLKAAYEQSMIYAEKGEDITIAMLKQLASVVMKNTGSVYRTALGDFSSADGDLRLLNVTAGAGGKSYMNYSKVPQRLQQMCENINQRRKTVDRDNIIECYYLSFDLHFMLVTIHPWADGNGRMSRLVMNQLQFELGIVPTIIHTDSKAEYIEALVATREANDIAIFRQFMLEEHARNIEQRITNHNNSLDDDFDPTNLIVSTDDGLNNGLNDGLKLSDRARKIISIVKANPNINVENIALTLGISKPTAEREIASLKSKGFIERRGSKKSGVWVVKG